MNTSQITIVTTLLVLTWIIAPSISATNICQVTKFEFNATNFGGHCWEVISVNACFGACHTYEVSLNRKISLVKPRLHTHARQSIVPI